MRTKTWHWKWSCRVNALLFGDPFEPLCSRVFRQPASRWRTRYLKAADFCFREVHHCLYIHLDWLDERLAKMGIAA